MKKSFPNFLIIIVIILTSCNDDKLFVLHKSTDTGIDFKNALVSTPELNILTYLYYYNGGGVSAADFNNDGLPDLYFTANQTADKLYLNKGDFKFEDITVAAGINNSNGWTTGVSSVDINNDGLMDIYVCKASDIGKTKGGNLLFINQGIQDNKPHFKEEAAKYGLDFKGYSTQACFFDYDLDGDLDMFLLNHSVHPNRTYGRGKKRLEIDARSGDKLFRNDNGYFTNVTAEAGIFQGKIGYGLGISTSDFNNDGYPDIYIGNDFFENDYLYLNQKNGTFRDIISSDKHKIGHTTHFSMGNDIADINNDGYSDIVSLDMLPEDLETYKTSGAEYSYQIYEGYLKNGYAPQYMQNTLHINLGNETFSESGFSSGIAATEWSWGALLADLDNDGFKDLFVTNGIKGATNDMDFINFISNENRQKRINMGMQPEDLKMINELPTKKAANYFFSNNGDGSFTDVTDTWFKKIPSYSNGSVFTDLDNDGDLDLVVNNVDEAAFILENRSSNRKESNHYLKIEFKGSKHNRNGIGCRVNVYNKGRVITQENMLSRGYLSSTTPNMTIGLGNSSQIDSLQVIWPGGKFQILKNIGADQSLKVKESEASGNFYSAPIFSPHVAIINADTIGLFKHKEYATIEFNRDPLIPFAYSNQGPESSIDDINLDGLQDIFIGGGKKQPSVLLLQQAQGGFNSVQTELFEEDAINEDVSNIFFDANNDGYSDLLVVSGGNEFKTGKPIAPRLYFNINGHFVKDSMQFSDIFVNASKVRAVDIDQDQDLDICITSNQLPGEFGLTPKQYIFINDGLGHFTDKTSSVAPELEYWGNIQDQVWTDINNDGKPDLIVAGHWMPVTIFLNDGKSLKPQDNTGLTNTNGWWNSVITADMDKDGDIDIIAGNWGLNSRLKASQSEPITLYSNDFDDNGSIDPVITYFYKGQETPFNSKDELAKQMPFINKKYLSYRDFAKANFNELLPVDKLKNSTTKKVYELASCYFENLGNGTFKKHILPGMAQISCVFDIQIDDLNNDSYPDILLVGNNYEISTQLGRLDSSHGVLLLNDHNGNFKDILKKGFDISGPARNINKIRINDQDHYLITRNNDYPLLLKRS